MGTGARYQRAALGQTRGESLGIQEHTLAMIPITMQQAEMELEIQGKAFEQEIKQAEELYLLAKRFEDQGQQQTQPIYVTTGIDPGGEIGTGETVKSKYLIYIGLVVLALYFLKGR